MDFDRSEPIDNIIYTLSYDCGSELNPATVMKENFSVYDDTDIQETEIKDVLYNPVSQEITLVLNPETVYNLYTVSVSEDVKMLSGETAAGSYTAQVNAGYEVGADDIGILDMSFYYGNRRMSHPTGTIPLNVKITVVNSSAFEQERILTVYLNDDTDNPLISSKVTLKAADTTEFTFGLSEREYFDTDVVNINLQ
ncbi:MAG: hypothetical protein IJ300_02455 [Clostridia bacterium]|nr:hypothetical protein [Clostridia bacterium]